MYQNWKWKIKSKILDLKAKRIILNVALLLLMGKGISCKGDYVEEDQINIILEWRLKLLGCKLKSYPFKELKLL